MHIYIIYYYYYYYHYCYHYYYYCLYYCYVVLFLLYPTIFIIYVYVYVIITIIYIYIIYIYVYIYMCVWCIVMRCDDPRSAYDIAAPGAGTVQESHISGRVKELRPIVIWSEAQRGKEVIHDALGWVSHLGRVALHSLATLYNIMPHLRFFCDLASAYSVYIYAPSVSSGQRLSFQHRFSWKPSPWEFGTQLELVEKRAKRI